MGQKVNPHGLRVGINKDWSSKWYANKKDFASFLAEDNQIRTYAKKKLYNAGVSNVLIERSADNNLKVSISVARPGMVIGKSGEGIDDFKKGLIKMTGKLVDVSIEEVRKTELDAQLTAETVAQSLERRTSFRKAMKQPIGRTMKSGAKGIKIVCSGRLGGAEIARSEKYSEGNVPLHTLRADIDYGFAEADTTYGKIGVKVWINHGEILDKGFKSVIEPEANEPRDKKQRRSEKKDRRSKGREGRPGGRDAKPEIKPATTRVRKTPKVQPKAETPVPDEVLEAKSEEVLETAPVEEIKETVADVIEEPVTEAIQKPEVEETAEN